MGASWIAEVKGESAPERILSALCLWGRGVCSGLKVEQLDGSLLLRSAPSAIGFDFGCWFLSPTLRCQIGYAWDLAFAWVVDEPI